MKRSFLAWTVAAAWIASGAGARANAQDPAPSADEIDQRLKVIERKLELGEEQKSEKEKTTPLVVAGPDGFSLKSAKGDFQLKLRGYVQTDGRYYVDDDERPLTDSWVVRRARPIVEGTLYRIFDFRVMPDFGGGQSLLYDGYVEARFSKAAKVRAGKFKPPVGMERLQSATDLVFVERGAPTLLVPSRDIGVQLGGELVGGKLEYAVGLFNGVVDGGLADSATTDGKEIAARLLWRPFQNADGSAPTVDLALGVAGSSGDQVGTLTAPQLPSFRSYGSQTFFSYRSDATAAGTVLADGEHTRLSPQAWLYVGPFGALVERVSSRQSVRRDLARAELENEAWQVQLSWVLTGERNSYKGVAPRQPFDPKAKGRGAWIVAVRASEVRIDGDAFPLYADASKAARKASAYGAGLSWNLVRGVRWMLDYNVTKFDGGAAGNANRPDEKALFTRFQVAF